MITDENDVQHNQDLISIYKKNLQTLEVQRAKQGSSVSIATINEMDNYRNMIASIEEKIKKSTASNISTVSYTLESAPSSLQKYENFITKFSEEMKAWNGEPGRFEGSLLHSFSRASGAKYAFAAKHIINEQWKIVAESAEASHEIEELIKNNALLRELLLEAINRTEPSIGRMLNGSEICIFVPFGETSDNQVLTLFNAKSERTIDSAFFDIINTIFSTTTNMKNPKRSEIIEFDIYNYLKKKYNNIPTNMEDRQFYLFNRRLENTTMYFEPIIFLNPYAPSIFAWEALARDKDKKKAPIDLFQTAELWGIKFLLQLDMHFLQMATDLYVIDYSDANHKMVMRKDRLLPLTVNVYPDSLIEPTSAYHATLKRIEEKGKMPLNKLYLEISEKSSIPVIEGLRKDTHPIDAFRERLFGFNDLDVRFSIDDFGVGYASSSRLSRIGPACIKIDRDALLDIYGNFTLDYVLKLARRMPGDVRVIVEGHDDESKMSLRKLYELGVRYVQSIKYGSATPQPDNRLPSSMVKSIREELKGITN